MQQVRVERPQPVERGLRHAAAADRGATELAGHRGRVGHVEVGFQVGHHVGVQVAAQRHHARQAAINGALQQTLAGQRVAVPAISPVAARACTGDGRARVARHQCLLGQQVPGPVQIPAIGQPALLHAAQQAALGVLQRGAGLGIDRRGTTQPAHGPASLVVTVLAAVQRVDAGQAAPVQPVEDAGVGPHRAHRLGHRLVLPPGLVGRRTQPPQVGTPQRAALVVGVVVFHLVVVPHQQPGRGGVGRLQRRVALVLGIAGAKLVERAQQRAVVRAHHPGGRGVFVEVVAQKHHQVGFTRSHVAPGGVQAVVITLATGHHRVQRGGGVGGRCGAGAAGGALLAQCVEAVEVAAARRQPRHFGMHAVGAGGLGGLGARRGDAAEGFVVRDLPAHRHLGRQVKPGQPGPQHHRSGLRLARGHAQLEARQVGRAGVAHPGGRGPTGGAQGQQVASSGVHGRIVAGRRWPPAQLRGALA